MENLVEIVSGFVLGLAILTPFLLKARQILKEVGELMVDLASGLEDGKLTLDECKEIAKEAKDILGIFKKEQK